MGVFFFFFSLFSMRGLLPRLVNRAWLVVGSFHSFNGKWWGVPPQETTTRGVLLGAPTRRHSNKTLFKNVTVFTHAHDSSSFLIPHLRPSSEIGYLPPDQCHTKLRSAHWPDGLCAFAPSRDTHSNRITTYSLYTTALRHFFPVLFSIYFFFLLSSL